MRAVVQRVLRAAVSVEESGVRREVGAVGRGFLILVGVHQEDTEADAAALADRVAHLRVFEDADGRLNRSLLETGGGALVVSNFTLYGDCRRGRRPSFSAAAPGPKAESLYKQFGGELAARGVPVEYGAFGAEMQVALVNDGPVTLLLDSHRAF